MVLNFLGENKVTVFVRRWVLSDGFNPGLVKHVTAKSPSTSNQKERTRKTRDNENTKKKKKMEREN